MILAAGVMSYLERWRQTRGFGFVVMVFIFFVVAAFLTRTPVVQRLDARLTILLQRTRSHLLDRLMRGLTILGDPPALIALSVLGGVVFWIAHHPAAGLLCVLSLLGLPLNVAIKELIRRPRPDQSIVNVLLPVTGRSFPSGHAMTAVMLYGFLGLLFWVHTGGGALRHSAALAMGLIPLGVGISRVYLGVHWFSDVIGGWTAGLFFLLIMGSLYGLLAGGP